MSLSQESTADVRLARDGDREAFARLYDRHARGVRAVVAAVSGDFDAVDDMTQETFMRAYRRLGSLRQPEEFRAWLQGFARHVAQERRREWARSREQQVDPLGPDAADREKGDPIVRNEEQSLVVAEVANLPERERLAVHAYFFHDQSVAEAAHSMGISRSGFYAALSRGMERLRQRLNDSPTTMHPPRSDA